MFRKQLLNIKDRTERYGVRTSDPENPETGNHDQFQFYEAIYATGEQVGVKGKEQGAYWRQCAIEKGIIKKH